MCVYVDAQPEQVCICVYGVPCSVCVYLHECACMCMSSFSPAQEQAEDRADDVQGGWGHVLTLVSHTGEGQGYGPR